MRPAILRALIALMFTGAPTVAQQTSSAPLRQLEKEMLARISARATAIGGFRIDTSDFDLRLPLRGEPHEIVGPTLYADNPAGIAWTYAHERKGFFLKRP